jgi:hypothetical protein
MRFAYRTRVRTSWFDVCDVMRVSESFCKTKTYLFDVFVCRRHATRIPRGLGCPERREGCSKTIEPNLKTGSRRRKLTHFFLQSAV